MTQELAMALDWFRRKCRGTTVTDEHPYKLIEKILIDEESKKLELSITLDRPCDDKIYVTIEKGCHGRFEFSLDSEKIKCMKDSVTNVKAKAFSQKTGEYEAVDCKAQLILKMTLAKETAQPDSAEVK